MSLKAGMIGLIKIDISLLSLFTEGVSVYVEDVHFIMGPNSKYMSKKEDFNQDVNAFYDTKDQTTNILRMQSKVKQELLREE